MATSYEKYEQELKDKGVTMEKKTDGSVSVDLAKATTSSLDMKDANFKVQITGELSDKVKSVSTGSANDEVQLKKADGVSFDLGNGSNTFELTGAASNNVSVTTGSGSDKVTFGGTATAATVNLGAGADSLVVTGGVVDSSIDGSAGGSKKIEIKGVLDPSYITLGSGNDTVIVKGIDTSTVLGGDGNNEFTIGDLKSATVISGSGRDVLTTTSVVANSYIDMGAGADEVRFTGTSVADSRVELGEGRDTIVISAAVKDASISGGADNDLITLTNTATNVSIAGGAGKDSIGLFAAITDSSIYGGADNDVVYVAGANTSFVDLGDGNDSIGFDSVKGITYTDFSVTGGAGKDTIDIRNVGAGGVTITDYDASSDVIVGSGTVNYNGDGVLAVGNDSVTITSTNGYYTAKVSLSGGIETYAWASDDAATNLDFSTSSKAVKIDASKNDLADSVIGSSKADSITIGQEDSVYGGAGRDSISIASAADTKEYVGLSTNGGKDSVYGFQANETANRTAQRDADEADTVYLFENGISSLVLTDDSNTLVAKVGNGSLLLDSVDATNNAEINVKDNNGVNYKVNYVKGTAITTNDEDELSDVYYAGSKTAALNFGNYDGDLLVDLSNRSIIGANTGGTTYYKEFATVTGGQGQTLLMGSTDGKQTLVAGSGNTTLWGGGSKADKLIGNGSASDDTRNVFYYTNGDGKDTVSSSAWGSNGDADVLWLGQGASVTAVKNDGTNTTITLANASDKLTLAGKSDVDVAIKFSTDGVTTHAGKVGKSGANTFTYESDVDFYLGGKKNTLTVKDDVDVADIWLDGTHGKTYQEITTVNASANTGAVTVAGGLAAEQIIAGAGTSSIWGGAGNANDTLSSSAKGTTEFYFGKGEGNDVITASGSDDKVVLYNVGLNDVAGYDDKTAGTLKISLKDGSSLTVQNMNSSSVSTFQLGDGSKWSYDASNKSWSQK